MVCLGLIAAFLIIRRRRLNRRPPSSLVNYGPDGVTPSFYGPSTVFSSPTPKLYASSFLCQCHLEASKLIMGSRIPPILRRFRPVRLSLPMPPQRMLGPFSRLARQMSRESTPVLRKYDDSCHFSVLFKASHHLSFPVRGSTGFSDIHVIAECCGWEQAICS